MAGCKGGKGLCARQDGPVSSLVSQVVLDCTSLWSWAAGIRLYLAPGSGAGISLWKVGSMVLGNVGFLHGAAWIGAVTIGHRLGRSRVSILSTGEWWVLVI